MKKQLSHCKPITCYEKEYPSRRALCADFGIEDRYNQFCTLMKLKVSPEQAIELAVDGNHNKAILLLKKGYEINAVFNHFQNGIKIEEPVVAEEDGKNIKISEEPEIEDEDIIEPEQEQVEDEDIDSSYNSPVFFNVQSPSQIIEELKHMNVDTINLIDFENVSAKSEDIRPIIIKENTVNVFFYNACNFSNHFFKEIRNIRNINLQVLTYKAAPQLIDHMIVFYLGALHNVLPNKTYNIITRDTGYCHFVESMNKNNINVVGVKRFKNADDRFKYSLLKYLMNNNRLNNRNCIVKFEFAEILDGFYKNKPDEVEVSRIIEKLCSYGVLSINKHGHYKFDMEAIKSFVLQ